MKKILFISFLMLFAPMVSANSISSKAILGEWICTTFISLDEYSLLETYHINLKKNSSADQKGTIHFTDAKEDALVTYESSSNWSLKGNILSFKNLKAHKYSVDNENFQKKYQILNIFADSHYNDIDDYEIQKLTEKELIFHSKSDQFDWLSLIVTCFREKS